MKPGKGIVEYTRSGREAYRLINGCDPNHNVIGVVTEVTGNICYVHRTDLQTDIFIWRFKNGNINQHFKWPGKWSENND